MENSVFSRVAAYLCIAGLAIMIVDSYCVPRATVERFDHTDVVHHYSRYKSPETSYDYFYFVSGSGDRLWVPSDTEVSLSPGDTFYIQKSGIFRKTIGGAYSLPGGKMNVYNTGLLRRHVFGWIMVALVFGLSIIHVGRKKLVPDSFTDDKLIAFGVVAMGVLVAIYIFQ